MHANDFNAIFEDVVDQSRRVLVKKADEYAEDGDRLHNFKQAAHLKGETPIKALEGMMVKHTVSLYDMMGSGKSYPLEVWDEKIGDHLNYLVLLKALVVEAQVPDDNPVFLEPRFDASVGEFVTGLEMLVQADRKIDDCECDPPCSK